MTYIVGSDTIASSYLEHLNDEDKVLLFAIGALGEPLRSKVKLQKLLFLVSNVFEDLGQLLDYEPHLLGPYSETVESVLEELVSAGLVSRSGSAYNLTVNGRALFHQLKPRKELVGTIEDFKQFINDLPDEEIMTFVYACYPKYIAESTKWDELKRSRKDYAANLLRRGKISFAKAAQIADMDQDSFAALIEKKGVCWRSQ